MLDANSSTDTLKHDAAGLLCKLRTLSPRVHCVTNSVAQVLTANALLALGAEPSMTIAPEEMGAFVEGADAALINLGTLDQNRRASAIIAAETATGLGKPFVLDPVFAHRSPTRKKLAETIVQLCPTAIRGNAEELRELSFKRDLIIEVETGSDDLVRAHGRHITVHNGHAYMAQATAMGCALGAVMAASFAVEEQPEVATVGALLIFGVAGEIAAKEALGPGSFVPVFIDKLASLRRIDIETHGRLS
ncbi:MAG: hydroxyethylthiazole kinase [Hyphomicrobiales bacterium]